MDLTADEWGVLRLIYLAGGSYELPGPLSAEHFTLTRLVDQGLVYAMRGTVWLTKDGQDVVDARAAES